MHFILGFIHLSPNLFFYIFIYLYTSNQSLYKTQYIIKQRWSGFTRSEGPKVDTYRFIHLFAFDKISIFWHILQRTVSSLNAHPYHLSKKATEKYSLISLIFKHCYKLNQDVYVCFFVFSNAWEMWTLTLRARAIVSHSHDPWKLGSNGQMEQSTEGLPNIAATTLI